MKEAKTKLLPGALMIVVAIVFMTGATFVTQPATAPTYVLSALGLICLCLGTLSLWQARQRK
jgi:hypothetical protein